MAALMKNQLIPTSVVKDTPVFDTDGEKIGVIDDIVLDKKSGHAVYALMSFGGFLGLGEKLHPIPWSKLTYNEEDGGYIVDLDKEFLEKAPSFNPGETIDWGDAAYHQHVHGYYTAMPYWMP